MWSFHWHPKKSLSHFLKSLLMIPIIAATGSLTLYLAHKWNEYFEFGGQLLVGTVAGVAYWFLANEEEEDNGKG